MLSEYGQELSEFYPYRVLMLVLVDHALGAEEQPAVAAMLES